MLTGKFNAFARAASKGELPKSGPLHKAAAFDLDALQKLAVAETTLVSWVKDVSTSLPEGWDAAGLFSSPEVCWQHLPCYNPSVLQPFPVTVGTSFISYCWQQPYSHLIVGSHSSVCGCWQAHRCLKGVPVRRRLFKGACSGELCTAKVSSAWLVEQEPVAAHSWFCCCSGSIRTKHNATTGSC